MSFGAWKSSIAPAEACRFLSARAASLSDPDLMSCTIPSSICTKPFAPASTTPARFISGSMFLVLAREALADSYAAMNTWRISSDCWAFSCMACAQSWSTVRMVPSLGIESALRVFSAAETAALASRFAPIRASCCSSSASAEKNWARIAPELPLAPASADCAALLSTLPAFLGRNAASDEVIARTVLAMLVPVSPSGTGNTLIASKLAEF